MNIVVYNAETGEKIERPMTPEEIAELEASLPRPTITDYENAIQNLVDTTARERQFSDGVTLASYTASTKPKWAAEAKAFVAWRDRVWVYAYRELEQVTIGARYQPTVLEFLAELEPIVWPEDQA